MIELKFLEPTIEDRGLTQEAVIGAIEPGRKSGTYLGFRVENERIRPTGYFKMPDAHHLHVDLDDPDQVMEIFASSSTAICAHGTLQVDDTFVNNKLEEHLGAFDEEHAKNMQKLIKLVRNNSDGSSFPFWLFSRYMEDTFGDFWLDDAVGRFGDESKGELSETVGGLIVPSIDLVITDEIPSMHVASGPAHRILHSSQKRRPEEPTTRVFGRRYIPANI